MPITVSEKFPPFVPSKRQVQLSANEAVVALVIEDESTHHRLLYAPGLAKMNLDFYEIFGGCKVAFIDGTFWSSDELQKVKPTAKLASEMGHIPVGGPGGLLEQLKEFRGPRRILIHINNTNPILNTDSPEYKLVQSEDWEVAFDGMEFSL
jgi:pyrroloquinoline quinone biosynthesis protein B